MHRGDHSFFGCLVEVGKGARAGLADIAVNRNVFVRRALSAVVADAFTVPNVVEWAPPSPLGLPGVVRV